MSYLRWSSRLPIDKDCPTCGRPVPPENMELAARLSYWKEFGYVAPHRLCPDCISHWYVFDHCDGGLAVWAAKGDEFPTLSYDEIRDILNTKQYTRILGFDRWGDEGVLIGALIDALRDHDDSHKNETPE